MSSHTPSAPQGPHVRELDLVNKELTTLFEATSRVRPASLRIQGLVADIFFDSCASTIADEINKNFNSRVDIFLNCGPETVQQFQDELFPSQSIPRFGQPDDVADVVGLLCCSNARWITGCVVSASGGGIKIG